MNQRIPCSSLISVAIIARDEARQIGAALDSVRGLAAETLVLLDAATTDDTARIAADHGARVVVEPWRGFPAQRNRALDLCVQPWVLFLDGDERVEPELAAELRALDLNSGPSGYWLPRHNLFFGQTLRGGGWYPDYQLRLVRRSAARYAETIAVHEVAAIQGETARLRGHLTHLNIERWDELWQKQAAYATQEARTLHAAGRRTRWRNYLGGPLREFYRRFVTLKGYKDGALGLALCGTLAYFEAVKFARLRRLANGQSLKFKV